MYLCNKYHCYIKKVNLKTKSHLLHKFIYTYKINCVNFRKILVFFSLQCERPWSKT